MDELLMFLIGWCIGIWDVVILLFIFGKILKKKEEENEV